MDTFVGTRLRATEAGRAANVTDPVKSHLIVEEL